MGKKTVNFYLFLAYGALMLGLLFIRDLPDISVPGFSYWAHVRAHTHLVPFTTSSVFLRTLLQPDHYSWMSADAYAAACRHAIINLGGNVVLFIPMGFLLPRAFPRLQKLWKTLVWALAVMTCVELLQVFSLLGYFDIDDLILNTLGAALGYGLHKLAQIFSRKQANR